MAMTPGMPPRFVMKTWAVTLYIAAVVTLALIVQIIDLLN